MLSWLLPVTRRPRCACLRARRVSEPCLERRKTFRWCNNKKNVPVSCLKPFFQEVNVQGQDKYASSITFARVSCWNSPTSSSLPPSSITFLSAPFWHVYSCIFIHVFTDRAVRACAHRARNCARESSSLPNNHLSLTHILKSPPPPPPPPPLLLPLLILIRICLQT